MSSDPCCKIDATDVLNEQIEKNRNIEDLLLLRKDKLRLIDESAAILRPAINREDSQKVIFTILSIKSGRSLMRKSREDGRPV